MSTIPPIRREILVETDPQTAFEVFTARIGRWWPLAFLNRMREAGYLVAAGPMADVAGEGMTILRLPGADRLAAATTLATEDDASVARGLLAVTVRPWQPVMLATPWS